MYYWDYSYFMILPAILFAAWAAANVNRTFKKYSKIKSASGMTAAQVARMVLDGNGLEHIEIRQVPGSLTDHYDPKANVIRLSQSVYDNDSAAAIGVAAHEAGHAIQYARGYYPIRLRTAILPISSIGSNLAGPLIIAGFILSMQSLVFFGCVAFALATLFQLVTLPVEFNASSRAMEALKASGYLGGQDIRHAEKTLRAAALTYVAALLVSLANLLRLILLANRRKR